MQPSRNISKYLQRYAESDVAALCKELFKQVSDAPSYDYCLCLPVYDENPLIVQRWQALANNQPRCLFIVVVNQPDTQAKSSAANTQFVASIHSQLPLLATAAEGCLYAMDNHSALLLVDYYSPGRQIDPRQGVGRARKIAADIALQLIFARQVLQPFIFCSDADANLPDNYFNAVQQSATDSHATAAAWVYPFKHVARGAQDNGTALHRATLLYEKRLNAYVQGLNYAGSPYAYHTLGSTICIAAEHYAMVRGFPCRNAGEDFYILNKLRKTGGVISLTQPLITLDARASSRTPFGTGHAAQKLAATDEAEAACFYHPLLFFLLRSLLQWFEVLATAMQADAAPPWQQHLDQYIAELPPEVLLSLGISAPTFTASQLSQAIISALQTLNFTHGLKHCQRHATSAEGFARHLHCWFDGFKTLKWLHLVRGSNLALQNLPQQAMEQQWQRLQVGMQQQQGQNNKTAQSCPERTALSL